MQHDSHKMNRSQDQGKENSMIKTIIRILKPAGTGGEFENYLSTLQRLDADGAPTREQARRDFRELMSYDRYGPYARN